MTKKTTDYRLLFDASLPITFKWEMDGGIGHDYDEVRLVTTLRTINIHTGGAIEISDSHAVCRQYFDRMEQSDLDRIVIERATHILRHEVMEQLTRGGARPFDPHGTRAARLRSAASAAGSNAENA